jgi:hypothetical protein
MSADEQRDIFRFELGLNSLVLACDNNGQETHHKQGGLQPILLHFPVAHLVKPL